MEYFTRDKTNNFLRRYSDNELEILNNIVDKEVKALNINKDGAFFKKNINYLKQIALTEYHSSFDYCFEQVKNILASDISNDEKLRRIHELAYVYQTRE